MPKDVEVNLSEVLIHLRDSGAFRAAVMAVAETKAPGEEIGEITLHRDGGELSDADLDAVAGGASIGTTIPAISRFRYQRIEKIPGIGRPGIPGGGLPGLPGFADTTW